MLSEKEIDALIEDIFAGRTTIESLPENLYLAVADKLKEGLYKGFGGDLGDFSGKRDLELLQELRESIYMFSGAKTYQEVRTLTDLLVDGDRVRTFDEFREEALKIYGTYNVDYLYTEYNTAIGQGSSAVAWSQIQEQKDVLPFLKYSAIDDERTDDICIALNGLVAPVEDPIWDSCSPLNHYNCRCVLEQLAEDPGTGPKPDDKDVVEQREKMDDAFKMNPGKDGYVFSPDHPYFNILPKDEARAANNFDLPVPPVDFPGQVIEPYVPEPVKPESEPVFTPVKSVKEANEYAVKTLGLLRADFSGVCLEIANDTLFGLWKTKEAFPELPVYSTGSIQANIKAFRAAVGEAFKQTSTYKNWEAYDKDAAKRALTKYVNAQSKNMYPSKNTVAYSTGAWKDTVKVRNEVEFNQRPFKGIMINNLQAKTVEAFNNMAEANIARKFWVNGSGDWSQIFTHELGHELDAFLHIGKNEEFIKIFDREHAAGYDAVTERLSRYGATAGNIGGRESRIDEMIAEAWAEYVTAKAPRELATEIGDLILKTYYEDHVQGTAAGVEKFTKWKEKTRALLSKNISDFKK